MIVEAMVHRTTGENGRESPTGTQEGLPGHTECSVAVKTMN